MCIYVYVYVRVYAYYIIYKYVYKPFQSNERALRNVAVKNAKIGKDGFALNGQKTKNRTKNSRRKNKKIYAILFKHRYIYMCRWMMNNICRPVNSIGNTRNADSWFRVMFICILDYFIIAVFFTVKKMMKTFLRFVRETTLSKQPIFDEKRKETIFRNFALIPQSIRKKKKIQLERKTFTETQR